MNPRAFFALPLCFTFTALLATGCDVPGPTDLSSPVAAPSVSPSVLASFSPSVSPSVLTSVMLDSEPDSEPKSDGKLSVLQRKELYFELEPLIYKDNSDALVLSFQRKHHLTTKQLNEIILQGLGGAWLAPK